MDGSKALPIRAGAKVYTIGFGKADVEKYGYTVTDGNYTTAPRPSAAVPTSQSFAVLVKDVAKPYNSEDASTGNNPLLLNPLTGATWGCRGSLPHVPATKRGLLRRRVFRQWRDRPRHDLRRCPALGDRDISFNWHGNCHVAQHVPDAG